MNDDSEVAWTNWRSNEPNNWGGREHYAAIILTEPKNRGLWYDHYSHNHKNVAERAAYGANKAYICANCSFI